MKDFIEKRLKEQKKLTVQVLGDSITRGETHCTSEQTYCAGLARLFAKAYPQYCVTRYDGMVESERKPLAGFSEKIVVQEGNAGEITLVRNGIGGNTVRRALNRKRDFIGNSPDQSRPDLFMMMYGINDALRSDPEKYVTPAEFYRNYIELCALLDASHPAAEKVLITPSYNDDGTSTESCLDAYCEVVKRVASERCCLCIDLHALWMSHLCPGAEHYGQGDWLSDKKGDCCHFSPVGSCISAAFIFRELIKDGTC